MRKPAGSWNEFKDEYWIVGVTPTTIFEVGLGLARL